MNQQDQRSVDYSISFLFFGLLMNLNGCAPAKQFGESMERRSDAVDLSVRALPSHDGMTVSVTVTNRSSDAILAIVAPLDPTMETPHLYYGGNGNLCVVQAVVRQPSNYETGGPDIGVHVRRIEVGGTLA